MIDRIIELSIRHRGLVIFAGLVLAVWGLYAVYQTPMDAVPDLSENQSIVFTEWPGHSPREIEDQITYPLSRSLQSLAGIRVVRGSSDVNYSMIHLIFEDAVDFATARSRIHERLSRLADVLPTGVSPRLAPDAIPTGQIFWYTLEGGGFDLARLRDVQDWFVRHQLETVPGVAEVASVGGQVLEYHVALDPFKLRDRRVELATVIRELARSNAAVGGNVIHKGNAEFIVRGIGWLGTAADNDVEADPNQMLRDIESVLVPALDGRVVRLADLGRVALGTRPRRGILEKDGSEVVGGVVLLRYGQNPLEVTRRLKEKIHELGAGLPAGVRIVTCYERTPLIEGAIRTVTGTVVEAMITASVCVVLVLLHFRTSFVIAVTLPLSALASFVIMWLLRRLGLADIQTNIMSLAGIAISIGVLVDSSVVIAENVMHHLREKFGDEPVRGDIRDIVLPACQTVGRPIFFSVMIMLISFLPVFALSGIDGKMYRPLAFTKTFALMSVAILAVTLVPALCTIFIKGRLRPESESWIVRSVVDVYRPVLHYLLDWPGALVWVLGLTLVLGAVPLGNRWVLLPVLCAALVLAGWTLTTPVTRTLGMASLVFAALIAEQNMLPLAAEMRMPLYEGMVMDMPITVPRASSVQSGDDLKARDMVLCRFPEVEMVLGKAGRAESPFDPAPLDMIETMVMLRPEAYWPRRKLPLDSARARQGAALYAALRESGLVAHPRGQPAERELLDAALMDAMPRFDAVMREFAYQRNQEFTRQLRTELTLFLIRRTTELLDDRGQLIKPVASGDLAFIANSISTHVSEHLAMSLALEDLSEIARHTAAQLGSMGFLAVDQTSLEDHPGMFDRPGLAVRQWLGMSPPSFAADLEKSGRRERDKMWSGHIRKLNSELLDRAGSTFTRILGEEILRRSEVTDPRLAEINRQVERARRETTKPQATIKASRERKLTDKSNSGATAHHHEARGPFPVIHPHPVLDKIYADLARSFSRRLMLWTRDRDELSGSYGGELDSALKMPGWTNVWTMPIQNRVDMLDTGVNTEIGVRVLGRRQEDVVRASEEIAAVLREIPGAVGVIADPIRGKGYLEVRPDREKAARYGVSVGDINDLVETAIGGTIATTTVEGRERHAVRVTFPRDWSRDEEAVRRLPVPTRELAEPGSELAASDSLTTGRRQKRPSPLIDAGAQSHSKRWLR